MSSHPSYSARVDALLAQALDLTGEDRAALLDRECAGDPGLRADVESLLHLAKKADTGRDPLDLAAGPLLQAFADELESAEAGTCIGPWRLLRELGRGGMGTVHLAERADGAFVLTTALKLLRPGIDPEDLLRRFERERQILARLDHPNVARLLDGGRTADGRSYIVMEYVEGARLDAYCDERRLAVEQRLDLFLEVGRAVQHAHRNLVVHRDLKPSNIVVTPDGRVKLLDFGIATLIEPDGSPREPLTRTHARVLTPEYASPEQVRGEPITTASDVYQLGLLLYELLTGQRAHRLADTSPAAIQEAVCERQPTRPSVATTSVEAGTAAAAARGTTPAALSRRLRGDLDNIVLMALRKEPERRYTSVEQLMEDIERYRDGRPVRARSDTLGYRAGKFVRRHALGVATAAAFALLLAGYAATVTSQARQLARERDRAQTQGRKAERVRDFLIGLFEAADPYRTKGERITAAELLDAGARQARETLAAEPEVQAEMLGVLGAVLQERASYERSEPLLSEALALQRRLHTGDHPDLARALARYADILAETGELERAETLAREGVEMRRRLFGPQSEEVAEGIAPLGATLCFQGRYAEAEVVSREALAIRRSLGQEIAVASLLDQVGVQVFRQNRAGEAEELHRQALAEQRRLLPPDHPDTATSLNNLAVTLVNQGKLAEAGPVYRESLAMRRRIYGNEHPQVANVMHSLGVLERRLGRPAEAAAIHRELLAYRVKAHGPGHPNVAISRNALATALRDLGERREAERQFREALAVFRQADHPLHALCALELGRLLCAAGRPEEGAPFLGEALEVRVARDGPTSAGADEARRAQQECRARPR